MARSDRVQIESWIDPSRLVGAVVESVMFGGRGRIYLRDDGTAHWQLTTDPINGWHGSTSSTILAEGDATTVELARGSLDGAAAIVDRPRSRTVPGE
jgi:hypothetical protein